MYNQLSPKYFQRSQTQAAFWMQAVQTRLHIKIKNSA